MGLFRKLGRQVEEFKQSASEAAREGADFECADCGHRHYTNKDACEECGADAVVPVSEADASGDGTAGESRTAADASGAGTTGESAASTDRDAVDEGASQSSE